MNITRSEENGRAVLTVEGWLDTPSADELARAVEETGAVKGLVLDFGGVEYICSSGLRAVLAGYKKMRRLGGDFSVVRVRDEVMEVFRLAGLSDSLNVTGGKGKDAGDEREA